jgi:hypothetical protein
VSDGLDLLALAPEEAAFERGQLLSGLLELAVHGLDLGLKGVAQLGHDRSQLLEFLAEAAVVVFVDPWAGWPGHESV